MTLAPGVPAVAHSYHIGPIRIGHLWAKPSRNGVVAIYGPLLNTGGAIDRLTGVESRAARMAEIVRAGARDAPIKAIALVPGRPVSLASWSMHIELRGVPAMRKGSMIPLTLIFAHAGTVRVAAMIENAPSD
jgi:hypothetical protein